MKKYALLIALAIAPSLAHDNLEIEGKPIMLTKAKLALQASPRHSHAPLVFNQNPFDEDQTSDEKVANRVNLETLIAEAEKTIAKLDAIKESHVSEKFKEVPERNGQTKFAFDKWAGLNLNPGSNYISGGNSAGGAGSAGGAASGGSSGGGKAARTAVNSANDDGKVVATAVPEPEIYLMLLAGLGYIGFRTKKHLTKH